MRARVIIARFLLVPFAIALLHTTSSAQFSGFAKPLDWAPYDGTSRINGPYTTAYRGNYSNGSEGSGSHPGVDISRDNAGNHLTISTNIRSIYGGVIVRKLVEAINHGNGWGNCVVIKHSGVPDAAPNGVVFSTYAHLTRFATNPATGREWMVNDSISKNDLIGFAGMTGRASGIHLHFQLDIDYSDQSYRRHPFWPNRIDGVSDTDQEVGTPDSDGLVLAHTLNPVSFVESHTTPTPSILIGQRTHDREFPGGPGFIIGQTFTSPSPALLTSVETLLREGYARCGRDVQMSIWRLNSSSGDLTQGADLVATSSNAVDPNTFDFGQFTFSFSEPVPIQASTYYFWGIYAPLQDCDGPSVAGASVNQVAGDAWRLYGNVQDPDTFRTLSNLSLYQKLPDVNPALAIADFYQVISGRFQ
jgi:murein DD-endopeptidase MepM/ murein hydrolase activator NlpD